MSKSFNLNPFPSGKQSQSLIQPQNLTKFKHIEERPFSDKKMKNIISEGDKLRLKFTLLQVEFMKRKRLAQQIYEIRWKNSIYK